MIHIADFNNVVFSLNQKKLILVKFYSGRVDNHKDLDITLENLAYDYSKLPMFAVDVDKDPSLIDRYTGDNLPMAIVFRNGTPCGSFSENAARDDLRAFLEEVAR